MALCKFNINRSMKSLFAYMLATSCALTFIYILYTQRGQIADETVTNQLLDTRMSNDNIEMMAYTGPYDGPLNGLQREVVREIQYIWKNYKQYAWGSDHLNTMTNNTETWFNISMTMVDSLDTLFICGMKEEFNEARNWIEKNLFFNTTKTASFFEVVIRELGGLLSAYHLSSDKMFLDKAELLAKIMYPCINSTKLPCSQVFNGAEPADSHTLTNPAEAGTWSLEYIDLGRSLAPQVTDYEEIVYKGYAWLREQTSQDGLLNSQIYVKSLDSVSSEYAMGGNQDSYYEYLLKTWLLTDKHDINKKFKDAFLLAMKGMGEQLLKKSQADYYYVSKNYPTDHTMEHLTCFLPGTLALAHMSDLHLDIQGHTLLDLAAELMKTCVAMATSTATGLAAEATHFEERKPIPIVRTYQLRPEIIESLFYMYRATNDHEYQRLGYVMFESIKKYTRTSSGFSVYSDVTNLQKKYNLDGSQPSYFISETLKYLYMLFSDDQNLLPLTSWVFNTEGHPLPIRRT